MRLKVVICLLIAAVSSAQSEEIQFETDGFPGEVPNGLTSNKPFLKVHLEARKCISTIAENLLLEILTAT